MFREMRLKNNALTRDEAVDILKRASHGTLALDGDDGYTYSVPVSFAYANDKLYFHGTSAGGHKLDAIKRNPKVSFSVVEKDDLIPADFNTLFLSAIAFGQIQVLTGDADRQKALELILQKYSKDFMTSGKEYIKKSWDQVAVMEMKIDHLTGKKGT